MNKKLNTLLFVLGATLFNILVVVVSFLLLSAIFVAAIARHLPDGAEQMGLSVIFIASIVISFFVYRLALNRLLGKIKFEDYFDPIIKRSMPAPKRKPD